MNAQYVIADRGTAVDIATPATSARWLIVAHAGSLRSQGAGLSIWIGEFNHQVQQLCDEL